MTDPTRDSMPETDPTELKGADPHTGNRVIDPFTGYDTTVHNWGGIIELNTPFPKIATWALILAVGYSVIAWFLLPAWPIGTTYTKGLLGVTQEGDANAEHARISAVRANWRDSFQSDDFAALAADRELVETALPEMRRLFADNCAACHGATAMGKDGDGGTGFPSLVDADWLWGGTPEDIAEVIRVGINSPDHDDTNVSEMLAFGRDGMLDASDLAALVPWVAGLSKGTSSPDDPAAEIFEDNCSSCHGEMGEGGLEIGAPSLADDEWIYGGSEADIHKTVWGGRQGVMPSWEARLSDTERHMLVVYLMGLSDNVQQ